MPVNFNFKMPRPQWMIDKERERLLKILSENQFVTQPQMGPTQPGEYLGDITARQQGTGLLPEPVAGAVASLIADPNSRGVGQATLQNLIDRAFPGAVKPSGRIAEYQQAKSEGYLPKDENGKEMGFLEYLKLSRTPAVTINQNLNKPLASDAKNWRDQQGKKPDPRFTVAEAVEEGFAPVTTEEQKSIEAAKASGPLIANLAEVAFGKEGEKSIFPPESASRTERLLSGAQAKISSIAEDDPRIGLYDRTKESFVSQLARLAGQVGTLTDRDVGLVRGLFPTAGFTPEPLARRQFTQIANLLLSKGVAKQQLLELGLPPWVFEDNSGALPPPPPGFVQE